MSKKRGLGGNGIDAFFPPKSKKEEIDNKSIIKAPINKIEPNKNQPRKNFDEDSLIELSESIKQYGVLQPLLVQEHNNRYIIIAGERRWRASKLAGLKELPIIINKVEKEEALEIALIENIQREDLNVIEEALAYKRLSEEFNLKQDDIADRVNKSRSAIANTLRLLNLSEKTIKMIADDMISSGHGRALLQIKNEDIQNEIADRIFDERLSVRDLEKLVKKINSEPKKKKEPNKNIMVAVNSLESDLRDALGTKVKVNINSKNRGKLVIEYYSIDDLERITNIIKEGKK